MTKLEKFMLESNRIEGEDRLNPGDVEAAEFTLLNISLTIEDILTVHFVLGKYLNAPWVGKFRKRNVRVGNYICPDHHKVNALMKIYVTASLDTDSWQAHNEFEKIHPFEDLNGRVGRLIWLSKAIKEGYNFEIPFLQMYYYQTLEKVNKEK